MICSRSLKPGDSTKKKSFTKSTSCAATLHIVFWAVVDLSSLKTRRIVTEITFPQKDNHNHRLDEFSIAACNTYSKIKSFIEECVRKGMGHVNTNIQTIKFAREKLIPQVEKETERRICQTDARFLLLPSEVCTSIEPGIEADLLRLPKIKSGCRSS